MLTDLLEEERRQTGLPLQIPPKTAPGGRRWNLLLLRGSSEASDATVGNGPSSVKGQVPVGSKRTQETLSLTAGRNTFQLANQIPTVSSNHPKLRVVFSLKKEHCECARRGRCPCSREDQVRGASCDVLLCACDVMFTLGSWAWSRSIDTMSMYYA